jgi:hypothetical protein
MISMYSASVPVFNQMLGSLSTVLNKAERRADDKKFDPQALLQARLYPDMFPLAQQVQIASDFAKGITARLAGSEVPSHEDKERSFAELQGRITKTLAFVNSFKAEQFDGSERREIILRPGTPKEQKLTGQVYLLHYGIPQFFFHVTTAYAILRHNGIDIGKRDYMGNY